MKHIRSGNIDLCVDEKTGSVSGIACQVSRVVGSVSGGGERQWMQRPGEVVIRDDLLRRTFRTEDIERVDVSDEAGRLRIAKSFVGAPWALEETYSAEPDCVRWDARLVLPKGDFRSVAISWEVPVPAIPYSWQVWSARQDMPKPLYWATSDEIEYAESTSGTLIPAFAWYLPKENWGFAVCKPFGLRTPCLRFGYGLREPRFRVSFNRLALSPEREAVASLLFRGIPGCWRPALGWVYNRHREYFESSSALLPSLWGGHNCAGYEQSEDDIATGAAAGERWCEIHGHFPHYGQYDAGREEWVSIQHAWRTPPPDGTDAGAHPQEPPVEAKDIVSLDKMRGTIARLNRHGVAPLPYIQVSGDANPTVAERFKSDEIRDINGDRVFWRECGSSVLVQMNADDALGFGKHLDSMIDGMLDKYTGAKGVFVDQACYNFVDTAHFDGITAIDNRPCYMTGFNFWNRLERVASRLHPDGAIMANGPHSIEAMRHIDGIMAEGLDWLCGQLKYLALGKPVFFLLYKHSRAAVERMLQSALVHAAGYTAAAWSASYRDIYDAYVPLLRMLYNRRWVFDPDPLTLPQGLRGDIYRAADGALLIPLVRNQILYCGAAIEAGIKIRTADTADVCNVELFQVGNAQAEPAIWKLIGNEISIESLPDNFVAGLLRLTTR
ncbi:MAG: hypothetical protein PHR35_20640 [Kiritimatiellae bacterium]|nr:hypothetical protein [Kiritimatiellia bacterium]